MRSNFSGLVTSAFFILITLLGEVWARQDIPRATPPGFPTVGMLEQHLTEGIGNFVEVDRIWDDKGDIVRYYFNSKYVKHDVDHKLITVWFLEEYTPRGRDLAIADWKAGGVDVERLKDFKYRYYQITLAYADDWGKVYVDAFDYRFALVAGGEVCDLKMKIIYLMPSTQFQKLSLEYHMSYIKLGWELNKSFGFK
ncbi:MAG: hypothetical protein QHH44_09170 [Candidatus Saccharicenans sp.]|jgi:hypothetical protein|nr:hypothetical protein [Candidatus Saccharicenans sp.]